MFVRIKKWFKRQYYRLMYPHHTAMAQARYCKCGFLDARIICRKCGNFCNIAWNKTTFEDRSAMRADICGIAPDLEIE